ncbi:MAG: hypothetical protein NC541_02195 [bacterium]|nr:hypothetical protein [bacterium]
MAFWSRLFRRKKEQNRTQEDWENIVYDRDSVDFEDEEQRTGYIKNCLEQIAEAVREVNLLTGEYALVTSYLTDIEEIEALPGEEKGTLAEIARRLMNVEQECENYRDRKNRMNDGDYYRIHKQEDQIQEGIAKLSECEKYGELVKQDLKRLDSERHAYEYRRTELELMMNNFRGMSVVIVTAFVVCLILLLILQFAFEMNARLGYLLAVGVVAVAETVLLIRYMDSEKELARVEDAVARLIQLQNKVKIRYVNNNNLQDYLRIKYGTDSAASLRKQWQHYQQEKESRKEYAEAEAKTDYYRRQLAAKMNNYHITAPERWVSQPGALLDKRETVEMRHELILQRQALRKQMDYNNGVAEAARREIMDIVNRYPAYGPEILAMVDSYEGAEE